MKADYHLHCEFSDDSTEPMENQIERAIEVGLDEICFTDHVDYGIKRDWDDPRGIEYRHGDGVSSPKEKMDPLTNVYYSAYFRKIHQMRQIYGTGELQKQQVSSNRDSQKNVIYSADHLQKNVIYSADDMQKRGITIRAGLEFGIQTITIPEFDRLFSQYRHELDFVLLSMHQVNNEEFWTGDYFRGRSQKEYNDAYYDEIYKVQQRFKNYSVLAHLDLLARYDPAGPYPFEKEKDRIAAILELAIKDGKGIEINTSSWHYGLKDTQPSRDILRLYKDLGGRIFTFGSDAHRREYVADHFADARRIVRDEIGIREFCTFVHMQPVFHPIED